MADIYDPNGNYVGSDGGQDGDVRSTTGLDTNPGQKSPPPNASAAPSANKTYTGLCEALNKYQQDLVKQGIYKVADRYVVKFEPTSMAQVQMKKQGTTVYAPTPMTSPNTAADKVDSDKQSMDTRGRNFQITMGTQIIQAINQIVSTSTYITEQANQIYDEKQQKLIDNPNAAENPSWFKVSFQAIPLDYDEKRNDYAYEMTFLIAPYAINELLSDYFNDPRFRGVHKVYNYWFTGLNNSVLDFTQEYNELYTLTMTGALEGGRKLKTPVPKTAKTASSQSTQGAKDRTNEPASNAMEYLFSPGDQANITLRIVGDPAWIAQGEIISLAGFNFDPFLADGTINCDVAESIFAVNFNQLADYDMETGLIDVLGKSRKMMGSFASSVPQESLAYKATKVTHTFNKGKFEQELTGILLTNLNDQVLENYYPNEDAIREQKNKNPEFQYKESREPNSATTAQIPSGNESPISSLPSGNNNANNPTTQPASPAKPATSNGDVSPANSLSPYEEIVQRGGGGVFFGTLSNSAVNANTANANIVTSTTITNLTGEYNPNTTNQQMAKEA